MRGNIVNIDIESEPAILMALPHQQAYIPGEKFEREVIGAFGE